MSKFDKGNMLDPREDEALFCCRRRQNKPDAVSIVSPDFTHITIDDKPLFDRYLFHHSGRPSDLTFTNIFIWRKHYSYSYRVQGDTLLIQGKNQGKIFYLEPVGEGVSSDAVHAVLTSGNGSVMERVSETFVNRHLGDDGRFDLEETREHWDYIYSRESLAHLTGRRYHRKRNYVNRFMQDYNFEYRLLDEELIESCRVVVDAWCREKQCDTDPVLCAEKNATLELLDFYGELELIGGILFVEGRPAAFTVGESLDDRTAVIHVEKAITGVTGLYQAINKFFCERELEDFSYVNREQDLGIEGLRKAKESYFPVRMLKKYRVSLRDPSV